MNWRAWIVPGIAIVVIGVFFIPVIQHRVLSYGIDSYATHTPLFTGHTALQAFTTQSNIIGLGTILVNLHHAKQLTPVTVTVFNTSSNTLLVSKTILPIDIHDDQFAYINFPSTPIPANTPIKIEYSAPNSTVQNPVGVRFGSNKEDISLALIEKVPVWRAILTVAHNRQNDWKYVAPVSIFALFVCIPALLPTKRSIAFWIATAMIAISAYAIMLWIIPQFGGVSGGDPYDYLGIAQSIQHGQNPFLNTKRLPGYPLLLVPTFASGAFDDQFVMRIITSTAGVIGIILIALIARTITSSWIPAIGSAAILAFQKDYIWTAMRPEPYAVYAMLLLLALYLFFLSYQQKSKLWIRIVFGLCLGYAAMTRQEGFVLAAVLGICSFAYELARGKSISRFIGMYAPAFVIVLPFFITNTITYHNPFYLKYLQDERLQPVDSLLAFQDALGATWGIIGSMWKASWSQLERLSLTSIPLISGIIGMWGWYAYIRYNKNKTVGMIVTALLLLASAGMILASVYAKANFSGLFTQISAGFILASIPVFFIETKWKGLVIALVLLSQIAIATWFHPFPKHYQQSYPLIVLMIGAALLARVPNKKLLFSYAALITSILPFILISTMLGQQLNTAIDKQNQDTALDSVTYRAARYARTLPQPIGFDQAYLPARLYFDPDAIYFPAEDNPTQQMEKDWLAKNPMKTMIVTNAEKIFSKPYPNWTVVKTFKAAGNDDKIFESIVYSVH